MGLNALCIIIEMKLKLQRRTFLCCVVFNIYNPCILKLWRECVIIRMKGTKAYLDWCGAVSNVLVHGWHPNCVTNQLNATEAYLPLNYWVRVTVSNYLVRGWIPKCLTIQLKATKEYFHLLLFQTFQSVDEVLNVWSFNWKLQRLRYCFKRLSVRVWNP